MSYVRRTASVSPGTRIKEIDDNLAACLPSIQAASHTLQNALEIYNDKPWPHPPVPPKEAVEPCLIEENSRVMRRALDNCRLYQLDMQRRSENREYIDMYIGSVDTPEARQHKVQKPITGGKVGSWYDEGFAGHVRNEMSTSENNMKNMAGHQATDANIPTSLASDQHRSRGSTLSIRNLYILCKPVPQPENMLNTFTHAICRYPNLEASPILTMTLRDTTPVMQSPTIHRDETLLHFEVGLDGVDGLCQGRVRIPETLDWKKNVRERRLGKIGMPKSGNGSFSAKAQRELYKRGYGQGWWFFFGVRFVSTEIERAAGKGGRWMCFGFPFEACTWSAGSYEEVYLGGGKDAMGQTGRKSRTVAQRFNTRFSTGGTACTDLFDGAEEWKDGVWKDVREAMAHDSLLVSFLCHDSRVAISKKRPFENGSKANDASGVRKLGKAFDEGDHSTQSSAGKCEKIPS